MVRVLDVPILEVKDLRFEAGDDLRLVSPDNPRKSRRNRASVPASRPGRAEKSSRRSRDGGPPPLLLLTLHDEPRAGSSSGSADPLLSRPATSLLLAKEQTATAITSFLLLLVQARWPLFVAHQLPTRLPTSYRSSYPMFLLPFTPQHAHALNVRKTPSA